MSVTYRTVDTQALTAPQASAWLSYIQGVFGAVATSTSIKEFILYRLPGNTYKARVELELSGTADEYVAAIVSGGANLLSYDGSVAVWRETRTQVASLSTSVRDLIGSVHATIAPANMRELKLTRGPNTSHLRHIATSTAHDWTTAEAAGSPLGSFVKE